MDTGDELLSIDATAALLKISRQALYTIVDERKELAVAEERWRGAQRRRYFRRGDVEAFRQKREGQTTEDV